jgi:hypothetical protein
MLVKEKHSNRPNSELKCNYARAHLEDNKTINLLCVVMYLSIDISNFLSDAWRLFFSFGAIHDSNRCSVHTGASLFLVIQS